ncbi:MAG TPA: rhomboid family intramembrane serine protease, partial [Tepidisphaeraceae bacterium]
MTTPPPPENAIDDLPERAPWRTVTRWLLVVNIAVYLIDVLLRREAAYFVQGQQVIHPMRPLAFYGHFSYFLTVIENQWWRLATYQFVHGGIGHLFANMMGLLLVGPVVEERFGRRRFLRFYL